MSTVIYCVHTVTLWQTCHPWVNTIKSVWRLSLLFSPRPSSSSPLTLLQDKGHPITCEGHQSVTLAFTLVWGDQPHHFLWVLPQEKINISWIRTEQWLDEQFLKTGFSLLGQGTREVACMYEVGGPLHMHYTFSSVTCIWGPPCNSRKKCQKRGITSKLFSHIK